MDERGKNPESSGTSMDAEHTNECLSFMCEVAAAALASDGISFDFNFLFFFIFLHTAGVVGDRVAVEHTPHTRTGHIVGNIEEVANSVLAFLEGRRGGPRQPHLPLRLEVLLGAPPQRLVVLCQTLPAPEVQNDKVRCDQPHADVDRRA